MTDLRDQLAITLRRAYLIALDSRERHMGHAALVLRLLRFCNQLDDSRATVHLLGMQWAAGSPPEPHPCSVSAGTEAAVILALQACEDIVADNVTPELDMLLSSVAHLRWCLQSRAHGILESVAATIVAASGVPLAAFDKELAEVLATDRAALN